MYSEEVLFSGGPIVVPSLKKGSCKTRNDHADVSLNPITRKLLMSVVVYRLNSICEEQ